METIQNHHRTNHSPKRNLITLRLLSKQGHQGISHQSLFSHQPPSKASGQLDDALKMTPRWLPSVSQMTPKCLPSVSQMTPRWFPSDSQKTAAWFQAGLGLTWRKLQGNFGTALGWLWATFYHFRPLEGSFFALICGHGATNDRLPSEGHP